MARRSDHSREELYDMVLEAARDIAEVEGLRVLTVRCIARKIGYSPGTLYNLFDNLDDLLLHLNARTLDALWNEMSGPIRPKEPEAALLSLVSDYVSFIRQHRRLWSLLFEIRLPEGADALPDWHLERVLRLLGLVEEALAPLFPPGEEAARHHSARVLWSSVHGICTLEATDKLVSYETVEALIETLIRHYVAGLRIAKDRSR